MKTSNKGRKFIESWEGLILSAYDDATDKVVPVGQTPKGTLTIGYGHTDAAGPPKVYVGQRITAAEADAYLAADLASVENEVNHLVKVPVNQNQYDALVSFQFNTGWLGHSGCSLLSALNSGKYDLAANDFKLYDHAGGQVVAGLTKRRNAERAMFLEPVTKATGTVVATTTAAAGATAVAVNHPPHMWPIIFGVVAAGIAIGLIVHWYKNRKVQNVVNS